MAKAKKQTNKGARSSGRPLRYIEPGMAYHLIFRAQDGRYFLRPDAEKTERILGILGRALAVYPRARLHHYAVMSNHVHMIVSVTDDIPALLPPETSDVALLGSATGVMAGFAGNFARQVSSRVRVGGKAGKKRKISGPFWQKRYTSSALTTEASERKVFAYVTAQGVKENLVARCSDWPGAHAAKVFAGHTGVARFDSGDWLDGTAYSEARAKAGKGEHVDVRDFLLRYDVTLHPMPSMAHLSRQSYADWARSIVSEVEREAAEKRGGAAVLGVINVLLTSEFRRSEGPVHVPWAKRTHRMIVWAKADAPETLAYVARYDAFAAKAGRAMNAVMANARASMPSRTGLFGGRLEAAVARVSAAA